jgi:hypothetical protein
MRGVSHAPRAGDVSRSTVDLAAYPDLVVIYLGMRVRTPRGLGTLRSLGKQIERAAAARPDGLLRHETLWYSLLPPHAGMRQYWRDFDALERWARALPHKEWWSRFLRDPGGTGFWHETYLLRGGIDAIYDGIPRSLGLLAFAPARPARGAFLSARRRAHLEGAEELSPMVPDGQAR